MFTRLMIIPFSEFDFEAYMLLTMNMKKDVNDLHFFHEFKLDLNFALW